MSLNQVPVKRKKAECCDKNTEIMLKVCIKEVNAGNKPHNHFTKLGWTNIAEKFNKATNLKYEYKKFRNRWNLWKRNDDYGLSLLGRTQVLPGMGRRKPLLLVMNGGKPKFKYVLFKENRFFVETNLLFFCFLCVILFLFAVIFYVWRPINEKLLRLGLFHNSLYLLLSFLFSLLSSILIVRSLAPFYINQ